MSWFSPKNTRTKVSQELGKYLPDAEDQLYTESEPIRAFDQTDADNKCKKVAEEYGGVDPVAQHTGRKGEYNCKFKLWG